MTTLGAPAVPAPAPTAESAEPPGAAVSAEVLAGVLVVALAVVPLLFGLPHDRVAGEAVLPLLAWPLLGVAGLVLLDRQPRSRLAWSCVLAAPLPCVLIGVTVQVRDLGGATGIEEFARAAQLVGSWALAPLLLPVLASLPVGRERDAPRAARRWRLWIGLVVATTVTAGAAAWSLYGATAYGAAATLGVGALAAVVATSALGGPPRPVVEPLLDALLAVLVLVSAGATAALVLAFTRMERIFAPEVIAALAGAATLALALPTAVWVRREAVRRRYGSGTLTARELDDLNSVLGPGAEPRALLGRAADVVTGLSGVADARLLLDEADAPGWAAFPLAVGDEPVGTLLVLPHDPEGLEERQARVVAQLLPTLALAARAVTLAVDAEHARRDLAQQRERERARILADLHDDLGPVLAGMGMRVQALRAARPDQPSADLDALAGDVASCRTELRRIVADLAPPALDERDLPSAVARLVGSFAHAGAPRVRTVGTVPADLPGPVAAAAYRIVAEGLTNAVRHARPDLVEVCVRRSGDGIRVDVRDHGTNGAGARLVPGTGLTSLRSRAEALGGHLEVETQESGTTLSAWLPERIS